MSAWRKIGVAISVLWMVGLPIYVMMDSNRRANEFYSWCRSKESNFASDLTPEQRHEWCSQSAGFMTPTVLAQVLVAGNSDTLALWSLMLGPLAILWIAGGIILATVRRLRRGL